MTDSGRTGVAAVRPANITWSRPAFPALPLLGSPLLLIAATHTEARHHTLGPGLAPLVQVCAAVLLVVLCVLAFRPRTPASHLVAIGALLAVYVIPNLVSPSFYFIIGALSLLSGTLLATIATDTRRFLLHIASGYLIFHMAGLAVSLLLYLGSGQIVDLHALLFPYSASRVGEQLQTIRLTGFHIEPGNYTQAIYLMVFVRALLRGRIANSLDFLAMASTLLTLSAWAVPGVAAWFTAILVEMLLRGSARQRLLVTIALALFPLLLITSAFAVLGTIAETRAFQYLFVRWSFVEGGGASLLYLYSWLQWLEAINWSWMFPKPLTSTFCSDCETTHGIGVIFNMMFYFGIPITLLITLLATRRLSRLWGSPFLLLALPLPFTKFFYWDFFFWLALGLILFSRPPCGALGAALAGPGAAGRPGPSNHLDSGSASIVGDMEERA